MEIKTEVLVRLTVDGDTSEPMQIDREKAPAIIVQSAKIIEDYINGELEVLNADAVH